MLLRLSQTVSVKTNYIQLRNKTYYFVRRIPADLKIRFGKTRIEESLRTGDQKEAIKRGEALAARYALQFKTLRANEQLTPKEVSQAAKELVESWGDFGLFIEHLVDPKRERYAGNDEDAYYNDPPENYLNQVELEAARLFREGKDAFRLSNALALYWSTHAKTSDEAFRAKVERDWEKLTDFLGDAVVTAITRAQARNFVAHCLSFGVKTTTVRRTINHINAVLNLAFVEEEISKNNPFLSLSIPGEGKDARETKVPSAHELADIVSTFHGKMPNETALLILLQAELGTRIGEVSGLGVDDVFLDAETPHVYFRNRPWRSLKTDESERRVPVVGVAIAALRAAMTLPRTGPGLFDRYARHRGNDAASQAVNKQLRKWQLTSHSFRHAMKDRLREAGCPKDIRDAIQGHTSGDVADNYGQGHTLKTMQGWLDKVKVTLS